MMRPSTCAAIAGIVLALTVASGSAQTQAPSSAGSNGPAASDDQSLAELKKRVLAYWEARVKKDYRAEYDLLEPRARARLSPDEYGRGRIVQYLAAQVESAERNGHFARVKVRLLVRITAPLPTRIPPRTDSTDLQDHWVLIGGAWYRSFEADTGVLTPWPVSSK